MPADKMVSYPMQNNGSLDEEAFFFGTRFRTLRCAKGFALWKPTNFCVQKFDKKLLFCTFSESTKSEIVRGFTTPKKHSMELCFFGVVNL